MAKPSLLIRNATFGGAQVNLLVAEGEILELKAFAPDYATDSAKIVDATGKVLLPSLIDCHVHLREPGQEYKETIASGLAAAAAGGFGRVLCMANTDPVNDQASVTEFMLDAARDAHPNGPFLHPVGALSKGLAGKELAPLMELASAGCAAFSNDGVAIASMEFFRRAMEYASTASRMVIDHCEEPTMQPGAGMNEGETSSRLGLAAQPWCAEAVQVARDILLSEYLDLPVHLAHVSCKASVDLIRFAKQRGVKVSVETCPHYLFLTESAVGDYDTAAKVNPPLRTNEDVTAMRTALADGTVDILATDHAPHARHEKEVEFMAAPCGISGLDTALAQTWQLVEQGVVSLKRFIDAWCYRPASLFNLPANRFNPGDPADFVLLDPDAPWTVSPETMRSKGKNTPLAGTTLKSRVFAHYLGGTKVF